MRADLDSQRDVFCDLLTRHQGQLYGHIFALVRNRADADDLFQAISLVLWRKFDTFQADTNFSAWSRKVADFEIRNFWRRNRTERSYWSQEVFDTLVETESNPAEDHAEAYLDFLRQCLEQLSPGGRELLDLSYVKGQTAQQIGEQQGRSRQTVCNALLRIRRRLMDCIQRKLAQDSSL